MSAEQRLEKVQAVLVERGARDVKFCFGHVSEKNSAQLASDVADALEAVRDGRRQPFPFIGDSVRAR